MRPPAVQHAACAIFVPFILLGWEHGLVDLNKQTYFGAFDCVLFIFFYNDSYLISVQRFFLSGGFV
jgi:hypothetical protein